MRYQGNHSCGTSRRTILLHGMQSVMQQVWSRFLRYVGDVYLETPSLADVETSSV